MRVRSVARWALKWHSVNRVNGLSEHIIYENCMPVLFRTRKAAREFNEKHYGYIKKQKDLRVEPHGWRMPKTIRVEVAELTRKP